MTRIRLITADSRGASAVEFALLAPVFLMFLFGLIETSRLIWTSQVVQQSAFKAARCYALEASGCESAADVKSYAVAQAAAGGITLAASAVTPQTNATCNSVSGQSAVTITTQFTTAVPNLLPMLNKQISSEACFPTQPPES